MKRIIRLMIVGALIVQAAGCASKQADEDLSLDAPSAAADSTSNSSSEENFSEDEADADAEAAVEKQASTTVAGDEDLNLDEPPPAETKAATTPEPEAVPEDPFKDEVQSSNIAQEPAAPIEVPPSAIEESAPAEQAFTAESSEPIEITGLKFKANETGGTILIESLRPLKYTTRANPELRQFIIDVENAILPAKLKRNLNTRDIKGSIGAVDAYQNPGSSTARFIIQLRDGVSEPAVQQEGNTLLVLASAPEENVAVKSGLKKDDAGLESEYSEDNASNESDLSDSVESNVLSTHTLSEFMAGNVKFYGKKVSIEMNNMDIREALRFITDESGVNMVISDEVKGNVSLKLRQVPWDQALVVLMKTKNLGYVRQGNVLRITTLDELVKEEDRASKLVVDKMKFEPLKVRMFQISYAKVDELEKKLKDFLTERGRVVGDTRTNAVVVTDTDETLVKVAKLIESLDVQPAQVLIEGKVVEAKESFQRDIGVSWAASGQTVKLGQSRRGPVNMNPSLGVNQGSLGAGNLGFNLNVGTFDIFGTLSAALSLREKEDVVKVLSSPRILAMTNETSMITQTSEVPVRTTTITNGVPQISFQFKPLTLKLEVTPQVTSDASIIMKINISRQFKGAIVDPKEGTFEVNSREANTRVLVKNGHTAVIGGIYTNEMTDGNTGVPFLRTLPLVGSLFSTSAKTKDKSEMLIFLTPRIVGQADSAGKATSQDF